MLFSNATPFVFLVIRWKISYSVKKLEPIYIISPTPLNFGRNWYLFYQFGKTLVMGARLGRPGGWEGEQWTLGNYFPCITLSMLRFPPFPSFISDEKGEIKTSRTWQRSTPFFHLTLFEFSLYQRGMPLYLLPHYGIWKRFAPDNTTATIRCILSGIEFLICEVCR